MRQLEETSVSAILSAGFGNKADTMRLFQRDTKVGVVRS